LFLVPEHFIVIAVETAPESTHMWIADDFSGVLAMGMVKFYRLEIFQFPNETTMDMEMKI